MTGARSIQVQPGQEFGRWTFLREVEKERNTRVDVFRCVCGFERKTPIYNVVSGRSQGCSACAGDSARISVAVGDRFGELTVLEELPSRGKRRVFLCHCTCGRDITRLLQDLRMGRDCCRACAIERRQKHPTLRGLNGGRWYRLLYMARIRGLPVTISMEEAVLLFERQNGHCAISGLPLVFHRTSTSTDGTASLDRIDSSKGYCVGNIQWVHKDVNRMKQDLPLDRFLELCSLIASKKESGTCPFGYDRPCDETCNKLVEVQGTGDDERRVFTCAAEACTTCHGKGRIVLRDAQGKVQKPEGWKPADIVAVLRAQKGGDHG